MEHDLDIGTSPSLAAVIELASSENLGRIIVSLESCPFCDASALTVLLRAKNALGSRLSIVVPASHSTRRIFEITGLTARLALCGDLDEALSAGSPLASDR